MFCLPQTEAGPLDSLEPLAEIDFLSGFRTPWDGSGPRGKHQAALQNEPGPNEMDQGPQDESGLTERMYRSAPDCA